MKDKNMSSFALESIDIATEIELSKRERDYNQNLPEKTEMIAMMMVINLHPLIKIFSSCLFLYFFFLRNGRNGKYGKFSLMIYLESYLYLLFTRLFFLWNKLVLIFFFFSLEDYVFFFVLFSFIVENRYFVCFSSHIQSNWIN